MRATRNTLNSNPARTTTPSQRASNLRRTAERLRNLRQTAERPSNLRQTTTTSSSQSKCPTNACVTPSRGPMKCRNPNCTSVCPACRKGVWRWNAGLARTRTRSVASRVTSQVASRALSRAATIAVTTTTMIATTGMTTTVMSTMLTAATTKTVLKLPTMMAVTTAARLLTLSACRCPDSRQVKLAHGRPHQVLLADCHPVGNRHPNMLRHPLLLIRALQVLCVTMKVWLVDGCSISNHPPKMFRLLSRHLDRARLSQTLSGNCQRARKTNWNETRSSRSHSPVTVPPHAPSPLLLLRDDLVSFQF